ncbi:MAG: hypothetical protein V4736_06730 [Bdellovibrionota bacterium]
MKTIILLSILVGIEAGAKASAKKPKAETAAPVAAASTTGSKLSTDVKFDGHMVGGKIQSPMEALTVVENEKDIDDLIGVRKNFKDRSERAKGLR